MADFHKVLKADPLGEPWTPDQPGAKPIQNYWCQVEGQEWAVSVGRQTDNPLLPGQHIYGDLTYAKSQKGTEYWKFKSQKVPEGVTRPADTPAQAQAQQATGTQPSNMSAAMPDWFLPINNMIKYIYEQMRKMDDDAPKEIEGIGAAPKPAPKTTEVVGGVDLDPATKAEIDDIFNTPEVPEDK